MFLTHRAIVYGQLRNPRTHAAHPSPTTTPILYNMTIHIIIMFYNSVSSKINTIEIYRGTYMNNIIYLPGVYLYYVTDSVGKVHFLFKNSFLVQRLELAQRNKYRGGGVGLATILKFKICFYNVMEL